MSSTIHRPVTRSVSAAVRAASVASLRAPPLLARRSSRQLHHALSIVPPPHSPSSSPSGDGHTPRRLHYAPLPPPIIPPPPPFFWGELYAPSPSCIATAPSSPLSPTPPLTFPSPLCPSAVCIDAAECRDDCLDDEKKFDDRKYDEEQFEETKDELKSSANVSRIASSTSSLRLTPSVKAALRSRPHIWEYIPLPATSVFISVCRSILLPYCSASDTEKVELLNRFLSIPSQCLRLLRRGKIGRVAVAKLAKQIQRMQFEEVLQKRPSNIERSSHDLRTNEQRVLAAKRKRIIDLIEAGDFRRATRLISQASPIVINEEVIAKLKSLHPPLSQSIPPLPHDTPPPILFDIQRLRVLIRTRFNNGATGGPSGWTARHLLALTGDDECMAGLCALLQDIANGLFKDNASMKQRLLAARLVALRKPSGGVRPIAIQEILYRLTGIYLLKEVMQLDEKLIKKLFPCIQYGAGQSGGCERALHLIRAALDKFGPDAIILHADFANAFNERSRHGIASTLYSTPDTSAIWRLFDFAYGSSTPLCLYERGQLHDVVLWSQEGVRQGDPLSALLFALSMQCTYKHSIHELSDITAVAVADDYYAVGLPKPTLECLDRLQQRSETESLHLSLDKCKVLANLQTLPNDIKEAFIARGIKPENIVNNTDEALGAHIDIGNMVSISEWQLQQIEQHTTFFSSLSALHLPVQYAFAILRMCAVPRLSYLCRVTPPEVMSPLAHKFDQEVLAFFAYLFDLPPLSRLPSSVVDQMHLPISLGGVGLRSHHRFLSASFLSSLAVAIPDIQALFDSSASGSSFDFDRSSTFTLFASCHESLHREITQSSSTFQLPPSVTACWNAFVAAPPSHLQHTLTTIIETTTHSTLLASSSPSDRARLVSLNARDTSEKKQNAMQCPSSSSSSAEMQSSPTLSTSSLSSLWLNCPFDNEEYRLANGQMCLAMRHRLGLPLANSMPSIVCACGADLLVDKQHFHSCLKLRRRAVLDRHRLIQQVLHQAANRVGVLCDVEMSIDAFVAESGGLCSSNDAEEKKASGLPSSSSSLTSDLVPDLILTSADGIVAIDVCISYPGAATYVSGASQHHAHAAAQRASQKHNKYDLACREHGITLMPFSLESFGAIDTEALRVVSYLLSHCQPASSRFAFYRDVMFRLSVALQRGNAMIAWEGLSLLRRYCNAYRRR